MRFVYIIFNNQIHIEVQQDRDRISPFIRNKKQINSLEKKLVYEVDKTIFQFIKLLNRTYPPYIIPDKFIFKELIDLIKKTQFIFLKKNKNASLKRVLNYSILDNLVKNNQKIKLKIDKVEILIKKILKNKVEVEYFFDIKEIQNHIPLNYDFFIPILETNQIGYIDNNNKKTINEQFFKLVNKYLEDSVYLTFDELNPTFRTIFNIF